VVLFCVQWLVFIEAFSSNGLYAKAHHLQHFRELIHERCASGVCVVFVCMRACVRARVCVCVRACVRACARADAYAHPCVSYGLVFQASVHYS